MHQRDVDVAKSCPVPKELSQAPITRWTPIEKVELGVTEVGSGVLA